MAAFITGASPRCIHLAGKSELQLDLGRALIVACREGGDEIGRNLGGRRRHGGAGAAELERDQGHLHGGEIAGMTGTIDLDDQPRHPREVARAFLDELHAGKFCQAIVSAIDSSAPGPGLR